VIPLPIVENSIVTQSRLILLDSPLILFTAFTALSWINFHNQSHDPFSDDWCLWLFLTGIGLGLSGSVKWVGLFIIATIGVSTINQLWSLWGDLRVTPSIWLYHFISRAVCLIVVPIAVYMFMFQIHFLLLGNSGDGDGFMSAPFQMTLGHSLQDSPLCKFCAKQTIILDYHGVAARHSLKDTNHDSFCDIVLSHRIWCHCNTSTPRHSGRLPALSRVAL
jgi:dolichyl-phosphate-mannose-protein mannosyltransferase